MSVITAYKSDEDGKIFEDKKKYQAHLRKLAAIRRYERKVFIAAEIKENFWRTEFWEKVKSPAQLQAAILHHAEDLGLNGLANDYFYGKKKPEGPPLIKKFGTFELRYDPLVSNTHSCPKGGKTNWGGRVEGAPRGYPGFRGRIDYYVEWYAAWESSYPGSSNMWKDTRIHTGSGGGGGFVPYAKKGLKGLKGLQNFGYQVEIFLDDWPGLKEGYEQAKIWMTLNNDRRNVDEVMNEMFPAEDYK